MKKPFNCTFCVLIIFCFFVTACVDIKKTTYFNNISDSANVSLNQIQPPQQKIQVNDLLEIKVGGENEKATSYISQYFGGSSAAGAGLQSTVDVDGNIELPVINKVSVAGLTRDEARNNITASYSIYLKNPIVSVKFLNFKFTVLGEVRSPGYFTSSNEKINLFEAVALAGDMTPYSKRENVKIIRETDGKREVFTLNFNDKSILNSPYYYINRSDIIYIEANRNRYFSDNFGKTSTILATTLGLAALIFSIFRK